MEMQRIREKKELQETLKDIYKAAKVEGVPLKTLRKLVKVRKMGTVDYEEEEALLRAYQDILSDEDQ